MSVRTESLTRFARPYSARKPAPACWGSCSLPLCQRGLSRFLWL